MTTSSVASPRFTVGRSHRGTSNPGRSYLRIAWEAASAPMSLVPFGVSAVLVMLGLTIGAAVTAVPLLLILAIAMVALDPLISSLPLARSFFDLQPLPIGDAIVLALVAGAWALALVALPRLDLPCRWAASRSASRATTGVWRTAGRPQSTGSGDARSSGQGRG